MAKQPRITKSGKIDKRTLNRGAKGVSGRKPKAEEIKMIEKLTPMAAKAYRALEQGIDNGDFKYVQLFFQYYAGKPVDKKDITISGEQPLFNITFDDDTDE